MHPLVKLPKLGKNVEVWIGMAGGDPVVRLEAVHNGRRCGISTVVRPYVGTLQTLKVLEDAQTQLAALVGREVLGCDT